MSRKKNRRNIDRSVKYAMICLAGTRCMYCGEDFGSEITWHHLKPRYAGGKDTLENASLLCSNCHCHIHKFQWGTNAYRRLTEKILQNREEFTGREWEFSFD